MGHYDEQREQHEQHEHCEQCKRDAEQAKKNSLNSLPNFTSTESIGGYSRYVGINASKGRSFITKSGGVVHSGTTSYIRGRWVRLTQ